MVRLGPPGTKQSHVERALMRVKAVSKVHEGLDNEKGYLVGKPLPIDQYAEVVGRSAEGRPAAQATA